MTKLEAAKQLRKALQMFVETLEDEKAIEVVSVFSGWNENAEYSIGDRVQYNDTLYKCLSAHTAQESWTPENAPSLWAKVLIPNTNIIPEWEQPDSTNPYMTGDKVLHNNKTWESSIDNNIWEPGVYGWNEI